MGFLGSVASFGRKFLGKAQQVSNFIGRNLHHVSSGLKSVQQFVAHPDVQRIGSEVGISPSVFRAVGQTASTLNNAVGILPAVGTDLKHAGHAGLNAISTGTKRSLADLYNQANSIGSEQA